ncbi:hypothetical protein Axy13_043 [Achromobacter phage vB_AxyP_19-32_Axy13]|uniref:PD-(D/E)XK endonuclease-like domain-containing protein n=1 Tax=Achromobacter phage vB_AxyP_19-32_Axy13 TaxID=2591044 RepID=A0A514CUN1_9CAUD|nr:hypothetical protein Axy13_043 [Achromobacter phage vB_AxyP_19-32_Axy13]
MIRVTNMHQVSLPLAVWLLHDEYDYVKEDNYISATALLKPLRHIVLAGRVPPESRTMDVMDMVNIGMGHALHDSIEKAWHKGHKRALKILGYPETVVNAVRINPTDEELHSVKDCIPIYIEQRAIKEVSVGGTTFKVGGKFDIVTEGLLQDFKSTSAFVWVKGSRDDEHMLQGSIYRWLNPDKIKEDFIRINYIFTDWRKADARSNPNYPQHRIMHKDIPLMSLADTEAWIKNKLAQVLKYQDADENLIPECTDEELWRSDPVFKYFSDPEKAKVEGARSTKNFPTLVEARQFQSEKGGKGAIVTVNGEPKRCSYCSVYDVCKQKDRYFS